MVSVHSEAEAPKRVDMIPIKLIVAGGFGVGKTTFVASLSDIEPLTTEASMTTLAAGIDERGDVTTKTSTTVAMDFGKVVIDGNLAVYLFGTPGQDRFGFMWDDLVRGALGGVVLIDSRRLTDCYPALDYFESRNVPYVVAVNCFGGEVFHDLEIVREALSMSPDVPLVTTDARELSSTKLAIITLLEHLYHKAQAAHSQQVAG